MYRDFLEPSNLDPLDPITRLLYQLCAHALSITLTAANEYGAASAKLFGVKILNEGFGTSIDDSVMEQQAIHFISCADGFLRRT